MSHRIETPLLVGNPFAPTGRGSTALSFFRAFQAASHPLPIRDIQSYAHTTDGSIVAELEKSLSDTLSRSLNIYHINADEIEPTLKILDTKLPDGAYNIIYPFWELSVLPPSWVDRLQLFNEVWAPSLFIQQTLQKALTAPIHHMPLPVQVELTSFLGRSYFDLPESAYLFLFFFDFRSYLDRKNPGALLDVFERVCKANPRGDIRVVIKVHGTTISSKAIQDYQQFVDRIRQSPFREQVILIDQVYDDNEIKNLVRCCDCFVSLHRSEGFGLGMAEAMYLGKPVIATGYSGNLDFMNDQVSCLVDYRLVPVQEGQYPYAEGQVWAEPDIDHATHYMNELFTSPETGRTLGRRASQHIRTHFSYLAQGLRYQKRLNQISNEKLLSWKDSTVISNHDLTLDPEK